MPRVTIKALPVGVPWLPVLTFLVRAGDQGVPALSHPRHRVQERREDRNKGSEGERDQHCNLYHRRSSQFRPVDGNVVERVVETYKYICRRGCSGLVLGLFTKATEKKASSEKGLGRRR